MKINLGANCLSLNHNATMRYSVRVENGILHPDGGAERRALCVAFGRLRAACAAKRHRRRFEMVYACLEPEERAFIPTVEGSLVMVLENKLGLRSEADLAREEERISKAKALEMFESGVLDSLAPGTFESLCAIHEYLFGDVYDFAGKLRTENISKGGFRFAPVMFLENSIEAIGRMPQSTFDEIVAKYVEMNVAHPFRKGNGRSMRIWLDQILKRKLGRVVDWSSVDKNDYLLAMERSPIKDVEIKVLLKAALTDKVDDREVYMKGIDASYHYEGYNVYRTEDFS